MSQRVSLTRTLPLFYNLEKFNNYLPIHNDSTKTQEYVFKNYNFS